MRTALAWLSIGVLTALVLESGAGQVNLAFSGTGAVPTANNSSGYGSSLGGAIDGGLAGGYNQGSNTFWASRIGGYYDIALPASSVGTTLQTVNVYDRSDASGGLSPFTVTLYDAGNNVLASFAQAVTPPVVNNMRKTTFSVPAGIATATRMRLDHTGSTAGDMFLTEIELVGFDPIVRVGGTGTVGTYAVAPTAITGGTAGTVNNVRVIQFTRPSGRLDFAEITALDGGGANVSNGAPSIQFLRARGFGQSPAEEVNPGEGPLGGGAGALTDNNTGTIEDSAPPEGGLLGITLAANQSLGTLSVINRAGFTSHTGVRLDLFSDTGRTNRVYSAGGLSLTSASPTAMNVPLLVGGLASAALDPLETYHIELDATGGTADQIAVQLLQAAASQLALAGRLDVSLLNTVPFYGQTFQILSADSFTGSFAAMSFPSVIGWDTSQLYTTGLLIAMPEPTSLVLLAGLTGLAAARPRRCPC